MSLPPVEVPQGAIRFNTDSQKLEFYAQDQWWEMVIDTPALGTGADTGAGARGVYMEGQQISAPVNLTTTEYINIASTGSREDFGNLSVTNGGGGAQISDRTRGVFHGENPGAPDIEYVTISSTGNGTDWGADLSRNAYYPMGVSNSTRGISAGSFTSSPSVSSMDFVTIQSTGTVASFGNLQTGACHGASVMSPTRGIFAGGYYNPGGDVTSSIQMVTIATTGSSQDFGDLSVAAWNSAGNCSSTRGVFALGSTPGTFTNNIEYITISTLGNTTNFGDMDIVSTHRGGGCCSPTRGVIMGGYDGTYRNYMDYITIPTEGNAVDWGNSLAGGRLNVQGLSNAHGGL
jgi:hypothetical protein